MLRRTLLTAGVGTLGFDSIAGHAVPALAGMTSLSALGRLERQADDFQHRVLFASTTEAGAQVLLATVSGALPLSWLLARRRIERVNQGGELVSRLIGSVLPRMTSSK